MDTNHRVLPQELVDWIVDHLHDDKPSLKACALVSKSWALSTYTHLFRSIHISGPNKLQEFASVLQPPPVFTSFIRKLRYNEGVIFGPPGRAIDTQSSESESTLHDVLRLLPSLRSLELWEVKISRYFNCSSIPARKYTLESLSIRDCIASSCDLECMLRAFDEIGSLSILCSIPWSHVNTPDDEIPTTRFISTPNELTRVRSIRTRAARNYREYVHSILATLKKQIVSDSVYALDLLLQPLSIDVLKPFLDGLLPNLHDLRLDLRCPTLSIRKFLDILYYSFA